MVMTRMGGWELLQLLQDEPEPVRFLMASGYGEADETGATPDPRVPFVQKPWTVRELLYQVRAVLDEALGGGHAPG